MGLPCKIITYIFLVACAYLGLNLYHAITHIPPLPNISRTKYWGPGNPPEKQDTKITPFTIKFNPNDIEDLKSRLSRTRYTEPLEGVASTYGLRHTELKKIVDFWHKKYDFAEREKHFNKYPHFKTNIQGLDIHFIHIRPKVPKSVQVLPMLLLHGWPGSVVEFYRIIPMLTEPKQGNDFVFELVIPSLPGFGWSQGTSKPGLSTTEMAAVMRNLMERLGHDKYYIQGGDWGAVITSAMATLYPDTILGYHTNFPMSRRVISQLRYLVGVFVPSLFVEKQFEHRVLPISNIIYNFLYEFGYFHIQATKPDTLGAGIGDSPAGLAAWILEKFSMGLNLEYRDRDDAGLTEKLTLTELIDNLMTYWMTNSATTAVRIYAESFNIRYFKEQMDKIPSPVPTAAARFPHEIQYSTDAQIRDKYPNLLQTTDMPRGGHFAAMEEPRLLADDIISAVKLFIDFNKKKKLQKEDL